MLPTLTFKLEILSFPRNQKLNTLLKYLSEFAEYIILIFLSYILFVFIVSHDKRALIYNLKVEAPLSVLVEKLQLHNGNNCNISVCLKHEIYLFLISFALVRLDTVKFGLTAWPV